MGVVGPCPRRLGKVQILRTSPIPTPNDLAIGGPVARKKWTEKEEDYVITSIQEGIPRNLIAEELGRSTASLFSFARALRKKGKLGPSNKKIKKEVKNEKIPTLESLLEKIPEGALEDSGISTRHKEMLIEILYKVFI